MSRLKTDAIRNVNASVDGITLDTSGNVAIPNELQLADKIVHTGDTNTFIRFPAADTVSVETGGTERIRIDSSGRMGLGTTAPEGYDNEAENFVVASADHTGITIASTGSNKRTNLYFADGTSGNAAYRGAITYDHNGDFLQIRTSGGERLRIDGDGDLWHGLTPVTHHNNRHAFFHNASDNFVSITSGSGATAGIVFGDSAANTTANYESYIAHYNVNNSLYLYTGQGQKGLELKSGGDASIIDGNLVVASGHGIDFSAQTTSSVTGITVNGELLDHFEEGTWTPTQPTVGWYSGAEIEGKYQRVGHWVTATFIVKFATNGSGVQGLIDGLPFASGATGSAARHGGAPTYTTDSNVQSFLIGNGEARIYIYDGSGNAVQLTNLDDDEIRGTVIYRVA